METGMQSSPVSNDPSNALWLYKTPVYSQLLLNNHNWQYVTFMDLIHPDQYFFGK